MTEILRKAEEIVSTKATEEREYTEWISSLQAESDKNVSEFIDLMIKHSIPQKELLVKVASEKGVASNTFKPIARGWIAVTAKRDPEDHFLYHGAFVTPDLRVYEIEDRYDDEGNPILVSWLSPSGTYLYLDGNNEIADTDTYKSAIGASHHNFRLSGESGVSLLARRIIELGIIPEIGQ